MYIYIYTYVYIYIYNSYNVITNMIMLLVAVDPLRGVPLLGAARKIQLIQ